MKKFVILLFLSIYCLISNAQIIPTIKSVDGKSVTMDISTYRDLKEKYFRCDTTMQQKDRLLKIKDSSIVVLKEKIRLQSVLLVEKDTTISRLNINNTKTIQTLREENKKNNSIFRNTPIWISAACGVVFGVLLVR